MDEFTVDQFTVSLKINGGRKPKKKDFLKVVSAIWHQRHIYFLLL